ncbi:MAG: glycosyltransferase [Christensenellales bacterium]
MEKSAKPRVVFAFVEAGLGHIMPMKAVCDAFERKYGDRAEVIRTNFFQDTGNANMKFVEDEFVKEVKKHNRNKGRGFWQFVLMDLFGSEFTLKYMMKKRYAAGYKPSLDYLTALKPDMVFNTHFATLYYSCEVKAAGLKNLDVTAYCPDPIIGNQWDRRVDFIGISSASGKELALRTRFNAPQVGEVPFLIRQQAETYTESREHYRRELGIPEERFTILLADGAYGAGKLKQTVLELLKSKQNLNVIAVCGKNEELYREFLTLKAPENICFLPLGFTDKMLLLSACCDLFMGKAGASNLAEPSYFGAPSIVTFLATPLEGWICDHYVKHVKCAVKETNIKKAVKLAQEWAASPQAMQQCREACKSQRRSDGPELLADVLWSRLEAKLQGEPG